MLISGLPLERSDNIGCVFGDQTTEGVYISERVALCVAPVVSRTGSIPFTVNIQRIDQPTVVAYYSSIFTICKSVNFVFVCCF